MKWVWRRAAVSVPDGSGKKKKAMHCGLRGSAIGHVITCHCFHFTLLILKFLPITHTRLCAGKPQASSISHPGLHAWLVFLWGVFLPPLVDYRCQQPALPPIRTHREAERFSAYCVARRGPQRVSEVRPGTGTLIKNSWLSLHAFFCMNLHSLF